MIIPTEKGRKNINNFLCLVHVIKLGDESRCVQKNGVRRLNSGSHTKTVTYLVCQENN